MNRSYNSSSDFPSLPLAAARQDDMAQDIAFGAESYQHGSPPFSNPAALIWVAVYFVKRDVFIALAGVGLATAGLGVSISGPPPHRR